MFYQVNPLQVLWWSHPCADRLRDVGVPAWCRLWPQCVEDAATFDWSAEFVQTR